MGMGDTLLTLGTSVVTISVIFALAALGLVFLRSALPSVTLINYPRKYLRSLFHTISSFSVVPSITMVGVAENLSLTALFI